MSYKEVKKGIDKETEKRDQFCIPIACDIMKLLASKDLVIGNASEKEIEEFNYSVAEEIIKNVLMSKDIKFVDVNYLKQLLLQAVENVMNTVKNALDKSYTNAVNKRMEKEYRELRLSDLDKILKS